jgi:hypothetical protein
VTEGLFLPIRFEREKYPQPRFGPEFIVPITYSEVTGRKPTAQDLWHALSFGNHVETIVTLSMILNSVERFQPDRNLHAALTERFLRPEYRTIPRRPPGGKLPDYQDVFNPLGVLFALKLLLGATTGPEPPERLQPDDQFSIGDLILLANEFVLTSSLTAETMTDANLAADLLPVWDLTNPGRIVYAMARMHRMVAVHLVGSDSKVLRIIKQIGVGMDGIKFCGVPLDSYVFAVFALYARDQLLRGPDFLRNPDLAIFNPHELMKQTSFPHEMFQRFLQGVSLDLDAARRKLSSLDTGWNEGILADLLESPTFRTDFLAFRERPILKLDEKRYLVLDGHFLADLLSIGVLFQVRSALARDKGALLMSLFGRLFELYAGELLEFFYPRRSAILRLDLPYTDGQLDALLDFGEYVVLLEFKFFLLRHEIKHNRKSGELETSLREKLVENQRGERKAARQLAHAAQSVHDRTIMTALPGKPIYPVVVIYESGLQCPGANAIINRYFQEFRERLRNPDLVRPLTVMSLEELEGLLPQVAAALTTWREVLDARFMRDEVNFISVHQVIHDILKRQGKEGKNNQFLRQTSDEMTDRMRAYFPEHAIQVNADATHGPTVASG